MQGIKSLMKQHWFKLPEEQAEAQMIQQEMLYSFIRQNRANRTSNRANKYDEQKRGAKL
ncbi:hypothetical protein [Gracilibacillus boraciitolerans]|uniref:hypothetical protein n=1 Tax=Gracilibacillus boraciitolerans TaxID=307521 RepID=UPI001F32BB14|nr:hypothetical protein [Gracilibacillus boraciitolerans]